MPEHKLSRATLSEVSASVKTPSYSPKPTETGIVHLGLGAFHRAHQAMVFDQLLREGDGSLGHPWCGHDTTRLGQQTARAGWLVCCAHCGGYWR
jgi:hypothetical protein